MADEAIIVDKIGTVFLAGPPLVFAATGEKVHATAWFRCHVISLWSIFFIRIFDGVGFVRTTWWSQSSLQTERTL